MKPPSVKRKEERKPRVILSSPQGSAVAELGKPGFDDLHARISCRAYELYLQRGCRDGHALEDWLDAEQEIVDREFSAA